MRSPGRAREGQRNWRSPGHSCLDVQIVAHRRRHAVAAADYGVARFRGSAQVRALADVLIGDPKLGDALQRGLVTVNGERGLTGGFARLFTFEPSDSFTGGDRAEGKRRRFFC